jgi:hypothetical protein
MKRSEWLVTLEVMAEYMPKVNMIKDILNKMVNNGLEVPTPKQAETLAGMLNKSYVKKQIVDAIQHKLDQKELLNTSREITRQFEQTRTRNTSLSTSKLEVTRYNSEGEVERKPIGFKIPSTLDVLPNRYTMDNVQNRETKLERFDKIFNE